MSTKGLLELEARGVRSLMTTGVAMIVAGPIAVFLVPFGIIVGSVIAAAGIITVVQAFRKGRDVRRRLAAAS